MGAQDAYLVLVGDATIDVVANYLIVGLLDPTAFVALDRREEVTEDVPIAAHDVKRQKAFAIAVQNNLQPLSLSAMQSIGVGAIGAPERADRM